MEFDQARRDVGASWVAGKDADDVAALAGAHADEPKRPGRGSVECLAEAVLHREEPTAER